MLIGSLLRLNLFSYISHLQWCLAHSKCLINVSYYSTTHPSSEPHTSKFQVQPLTFLPRGTGSPSPGHPSRHRSLYTSANSSPLRKTVHHFLKIPGDTGHSYPSQHHHPGFSHLHYLPPPSLPFSTLICPPKNYILHMELKRAILESQPGHVSLLLMKLPWFPSAHW